MKLIKNSKKTFIIAEIGNNHEGSFINAKKLIKLASKAGVDAVKFQTFKTSNFVNLKDWNKYEKMKKFELSFSNFVKLKKYANSLNLKFISTPLDFESLDFLKKNVDAIKIASGDNNFLFFLQEAIKTKKEIIISTGMSSYSDVINLIKNIKQIISNKCFKKKIHIMHCVTSYPVLPNYANLKSIPFLSKKLKLKVGYSDHTMGYQASLCAVSLGAHIIEKHFTLDKNYSSFRDHAISADFNEMKIIVKNCRLIEQMLGKEEKKIEIVEKPFLKTARRSIYAKKKIKKNQVLVFDDLLFMRPYYQCSTLNLKEYLGKKTKKEILKNALVKKSDLL